MSDGGLLDSLQSDRNRRNTGAKRHSWNQLGGRCANPRIEVGPV
jgi:hypothetical protein